MKEAANRGGLLCKHGNTNLLVAWALLKGREHIGSGSAARAVKAVKKPLYLTCRDRHHRLIAALIWNLFGR